MSYLHEIKAYCQGTAAHSTPAPSHKLAIVQSSRLVVNKVDEAGEFPVHVAWYLVTATK